MSLLTLEKRLADHLEVLVVVYRRPDKVVNNMAMRSTVSMLLSPPCFFAEKPHRFVLSNYYSVLEVDYRIPAQAGIQEKPVADTALR